MTHLDQITNRQKKSFLRDVAFAACVALAAVAAVTGVSTAVAAAQTTTAHR